MATISQRSQNLFRRSAHSSFSGSMEGEQLTTGGSCGSTATLPRQGSSFSTKLPPMEAGVEPTGNEPVITLTQTVRQRLC